MPNPAPNTPQEQPPTDGWELMCEGILRTRFGRRDSRALAKAMTQLAAEEAARPEVQPRRAGPAVRPGPTLASWWERLQEWLTGSSLRPALAVATAAAVLVAVAGIVWLLAEIRLAHGHAPMCMVSDSLGAKSGQSPRLKAGDILSRKLYRIESGAVELTFASQAKVAVEGPAEIRITDGNSMELWTGKICAEVPVSARGFEVRTPSAQVVDLGTRFGTSVTSNQVTEVDVFQGRVEVTAGTNRANPSTRWRLFKGMAVRADVLGGATSVAHSESAFPQPGLSVLARPQNCGFDEKAHAVTGDFPAAFSFWSGQAYSMTGRSQGIVPFSGTGMLQFSNNPASPGQSEVWQLVNMRPFKAVLASGPVEAKLSAVFNRVAGSGLSGDKFGLTLAAFHGGAAEAPALWAARATAALALTDSQLAVDDNPATWEKIQVSARLPEETDFVVIGLRAIATRAAPGQTLFPGHFADLVDLKLCTPMRASSSAVNR